MVATITASIIAAIIAAIQSITIMQSAITMSDITTRSTTTTTGNIQPEHKGGHITPLFPFPQNIPYRLRDTSVYKLQKK